MDSIEALIITHEPLTELDLKRIVLLFDRVYLLHPQENLFLIPENIVSYSAGGIDFHLSAGYVPLYDGPPHEDQEYELLDRFDYALGKGIIKPLNLTARRFYQKYWLPLRLAYDFDTGNAELLKKTKPLLLHKEDIETENGILRGLFFEPNGIKIYPAIPEDPEVFDGELDKKYHLNSQAFSILARLDKGLAASGEYGLIPFFTDPHMARLFSMKSMIATKNPEAELAKKFREAKGVELRRVQHLLYK